MATFPSQPNSERKAITPRAGTVCHLSCCQIIISLITTTWCNSIYETLMGSVIKSRLCLCVYQHLYSEGTSCPSVELFVPSKHRVIDAAANQDSDHTAMTLAPTSTQTLRASPRRVVSQQIIHLSNESSLVATPYVTAVDCERCFYSVKSLLQ